MTAPGLQQALVSFDALQQRDNPGVEARRAGRPDLAALHAEALVLADEIRRVQRRPDPAATAARMGKAWRTTAANFARNQWRVRSRDSDVLRPMYAIYSMLDACNHRCVYCDDHTGQGHFEAMERDKRRLDTDGVFELLRVLRTGVSAIFYTGGETMMRPDLPQILRRASELGFYPQTLNSNATLAHKRLVDPAWSNVLEDVDVLSISLDSLSISTLTEMYGAPALPKADILRNLLALRELAEEYGFRLGINAVVQPGAVGHARDALDFANAFGITFAGVTQNLEAGPLPGLMEAPRYQQLAETILARHKEGFPFMGPKTYNRGVFMGERFTARGRPVGCRPVLKPYIEPDGIWEAPCNATSKAEKVRVKLLDFERLDDAWDWADARAGFDGYYERCGGDCLWAQHVGANYYYYGLFHPLKTMREAWRFTHSPAD